MATSRPTWKFASLGWWSQRPPWAALTVWTVRRVGPASQAASDARSAVTGRVVDSYSNIHSVKMFAHHDLELEQAREVIETSRKTFQREMRIFTVMDVSLIVVNGLLIVGVVGLALGLWIQGLARRENCRCVVVAVGVGVSWKFWPKIHQL